MKAEKSVLDRTEKRELTLFRRLPRTGGEQWPQKNVN